METTSTTLRWAVLLMIVNPDVQVNKYICMAINTATGVD